MDTKAVGATSQEVVQSPLGDLTKRQREAYQAIVSLTMRSGAPSLEDLRVEMGLPTKQAAHFHVQALARRGLVTSPKPGSYRRGIHLALPTHSKEN